MSKIVVALGGNALGELPKEQLELVKGTAKSLVGLIKKGYGVIINHGNEPQVGSINLGLDYAAEYKQGPPFPFPECDAMSQAYIDYQMQESLLNELHTLGIKEEIVTLVTQIEVANDDPTSQSPAKSVGLFYTKEQAEKTKEEKGYTFMEDAGRRYRRAVPSPQPINTVELNNIETLIEHGTLVITAGGGGVSVVKERDRYQGADTAIGKDKAGALLAAHLQSDQLVILTTVDYVYINHGEGNQEGLGDVTVNDMEGYIANNQFAKGSMLLKAEAALRLIKKNPKGSVLITSLSSLSDALGSKISTRTMP